MVDLHEAFRLGREIRGDLPHPRVERRLRRRLGNAPTWLVLQLGDGECARFRLSHEDADALLREFSLASG